MADTAATAEATPAAVGASPVAKKSKSSAAIAKKPRVKPTHPPTAEMVYNAIKSLKERSGSSLQAIKKYLTSNYKIDAEKLAPFIKKYLKGAVTSGKLIQTKGKGASGSFKLAVKESASAKSTATSAAKKKKAAADKKPKVAKKVTSAATKKKPAAAAASTTVKKATKVAGTDKKKASAATAKAAKAKSSVKAAKSPKQKPTKATKKEAVKKPKTPKPKKATATKKAATGGAAKKPVAPKKK